MGLARRAFDEQMDRREAEYRRDLVAARTLAVDFARTDSLNDDPAFTGILAGVVRRALQGGRG